MDFSTSSLHDFNNAFSTKFMHMYMWLPKMENSPKNSQSHTFHMDFLKHTYGHLGRDATDLLNYTGGNNYMSNFINFYRFAIVFHNWNEVYLYVSNPFEYFPMCTLWKSTENTVTYLLMREGSSACHCDCKNIMWKLVVLPICETVIRNQQESMYLYQLVEWHITTESCWDRQTFVLSTH